MSSGTGAFVERSGAVVDLGRSRGEFGGNGGFVLSDGTRMSEAVQAIRRYEVVPRSFPRGKWPRADGSPIHPFVNPRLGRLDLRVRLEPRPANIEPRERPDAPALSICLRSSRYPAPLQSV